MSAGSNDASNSGSRSGRGSLGRGDRVTADDFSLEVAQGLYGLEHIEMMWERRLDTFALIGWGPGRVVVVFRGTNSLRNVLADLQVWQLA
jgi:hypothetical protein